MPWIEPAEPHAKPPRVRDPGRPPEWDGPLVNDRGAAEIDSVDLTRPEQFDIDGLEELSIRDTTVTGLSLAGATDLALDVHRSRLDSCDLSGLRVVTLRNSRIVGSKLIGTDFTGATVADVVFERCAFRYGNWRMASFKRVSFVECTIDDVDGFELTMEDVDVPGTSIDGLNVDRLDANRFDLRAAAEIGLRAVSGLKGCLVAEHQIPALAYSLALAAGVDIERTPSVEDA